MILKRCFAMLVVLSFFLTITNPPIKQADATTKPSNPTLEQAQKALQSQSEFFTENKGQWDSNILFVGDTSFGKVAFAKDAIYYQMIKVTEKETKDDSALSMENIPNKFDQKEKEYESQVIKLSFVDSLTPTIQGAEVLSHYNNYFIGNDPKKWASYCRNFAKVTYQDVWTGIDLAYFFTPEGMKYEYYVEPEAKIQDLQVRVVGAVIASIGNSMQITTEFGNIQDANLKVFEQESRKVIDSTFKTHNNVFSFRGIPEKRDHIIVIDPLVYSTYLGGSIFELDPKISIDMVGNAYITGGTYSTDFPTTPGTYQTINKENGDAFVTKLNPNGTTLIYSTYLGGLNEDLATDIGVETGGNTFITGYTFSADFPTSPGANQTINKGNGDAFVTKLNPSGTALVYSTFLGGSGQEDYLTGRIVLDESANAYICGSTQSTDFPTTSGAFQTSSYPFNSFGWDTGYVTKLNPTGTALIYSTYLGGSDIGACCYCITLDKLGNAYIFGDTWSTDFPATPGAYQAINKGFIDCFVTKLNPTGTALVYSTYLGGSGHEWGQGGISVDTVGNAYVCGFTMNTDFPTTSGAYQTTHKGNSDVFVTKVNPTGTALIYSTFLGGSGDDYPFGSYLDVEGSLIIAGPTSSEDFPTTLGAYQNNLKRSNNLFMSKNVFVTKVNTTGSDILYSTYFGENLLWRVRTGGIATDNSGKTYICGLTYSSRFFTTPGAFQTKCNGYVNAFISKLDLFLFDISLTGSLHFNEVNLAWNNINPGNIAINSYQIYRANVADGLFQPLAYVEGANNRTYTDTIGEIGKTYSYYIVALNHNKEPVGVSNTITLGPIQPVPQPLLELSILTNKTEFCTGEDILCKVAVLNNGYASATETILKVTFPHEIEFQSADKYRDEVQPSGQVIFYLGVIPARSSVTFQINASVDTVIPFEKSVATFFETSCKEGSIDQQTINLTLKRCGGGSPVLDILAYYKNVHSDPETGEIYLLQTEELEMDVTFSGFMTPLSYEIQWGDGAVDQKDKQTETKYIMKHKFTSKGKMIIKIKATDASGRSKSVSLSLLIK